MIICQIKLKCGKYTSLVTLLDNPDEDGMLVVDSTRTEDGKRERKVDKRKHTDAAFTLFAQTIGEHVYYGHALPVDW